MVKYLVKRTSTRYVGNSIFPSARHVYYTGKKGQLVACRGASIHGYPETPQDDYFTRTYGYDRLCDVKRAYEYTHCHDEYCDGFRWSNNVEIVTIDVRG